MGTQGHKIQFIDLVKQYQHYKTEIHQAVDTVLESGAYILGPQVGQLEEALAEYANAKHCIAVGSGTDALTVALMALEVGPGDEVITTPFSFIAAVEAILLLGATPVFVDIDPQTYCLDPQQLEAAISPLTKAIIPVGLYGHMADMERITAIAAPYGIPVIEDAAQCYGGEQNGRKSCSVSELAITSFYPAKPLGGCGEAGAIFARDRDLAQKIRVIHNHGCSQKYVHTALGVNARCDTIQAAILQVKLKHFDEELRLRRQVADWYSQELPTDVLRPQTLPGYTHTYAQYTIRVPDRESFVERLNKMEIPTACHYPVTLDQQAAVLGKSRNAGELTNAYRAANEVISLPMHPWLTHEDVKQIAEGIKIALSESLCCKGV